MSELGEASTINEGLAAQSWQEIEAWSNLTGTYLNPVEYIALIRLSRSYVSQYFESLEVGCGSPCIDELPNKDQVANKLKVLFAMLRKK